MKVPRAPKGHADLVALQNFQERELIQQQSQVRMAKHVKRKWRKSTKPPESPEEKERRAWRSVPNRPMDESLLEDLRIQRWEGHLPSRQKRRREIL